MNAIAKKVDFEISRLDTAPNGIYLVKTKRAWDELLPPIQAAVKMHRLGSCTFISLCPDESIELLSDERLAELGLKKL